MIFLFFFWENFTMLPFCMSISLHFFNATKYILLFYTKSHKIWYTIYDALLFQFIIARHLTNLSAYLGHADTKECIFL